MDKTHSAEAAARENGDLHAMASKLCANVHPHDSLRKDDSIYDFYTVRREHVHALLNALYIHQRQGTESDQRLIKNAKAYASWDVAPMQAVSFITLLCERVDTLSRAPQPDTEMEYRLGAAYQVIGALLDRLGVHDSDKGQRLLDYFAGYKDAPDPLPFDAYALAPQPDTVTVPISLETAQSVVDEFEGYPDTSGLNFIKSDDDEVFDLTVGTVRAALAARGKA